MAKSQTLTMTAAVVALVVAIAGPLLYGSYSHAEELLSLIQEKLPLPLSSILSQISPSSSTFVCQPHTYTTEIITIDPLIIYIHDFLSPSEVPVLLEAGESLFQPSGLSGTDGQKWHSGRRTSNSAVLPTDDQAVQCVLDRAEKFLGTMLTLPHDDIQPPQLVRYTVGQKFDEHADWFGVPQARRPDSTGLGSSWDRIASFFAILEDDCTAGETWFPHIPLPKSIVDAADGDGKDRVWRVHEDGGIAFKPVARNALFWVNLFANGTGDERTRHAGLPVDSGRKTAMNIWPRVYYD